jgi:peptidoglycan hydrolase-like protein with peptidoglycan-binding domain
VTRLSRRVYQLNVQMLRLLEDESLGRSAPRVSLAADVRPAEYLRLEIGSRGREVRRLQRALHRAGEDVDIDGVFGQKTWEAVRSVQRSRGLNVDGIPGRRTWAELPSGAPMPILRTGSRGDAVVQLQRVLAHQAQDRWQSSPQAATGTFDASPKLLDPGDANAGGDLDKRCARQVGVLATCRSSARHLAVR